MTTQRTPRETAIGEKTHPRRPSDARVTSRDIARLAGVSQATVSRVLTGSANVTAQRRDRVLRALEHTGYQPNAMAQAMKTGRTGTVGVVIARIMNPFYPELLETIGRELAAVDHRMIVWETGSAGEDSAVDAIHQGLVDGVIFTTAMPGSVAVDEATRRDAPMVLVNRTLAGAGCDQVSSLNVDGARLAGRYLTHYGHRRIGFIGGTPNASTAEERERGFQDALRAAGLLDGLDARGGDFSHETAHRVAHAMLDTDDPPTAVFGVNDLTAFGILDAARSLGVRVPDDVWVIGFDDIAMAAWESFDLTSVCQPTEDMARFAVQQLMHRIAGRGPAEPMHRRFPCDLVVRGSTDHKPLRNHLHRS